MEHYIRHAEIGEDVSLGPGVMIGTEGLWVDRQEDGTLKRRVAKGRVVIENHVTVGARAMIQRGFERDTVIGEGTAIGPDAVVGHDCIIGKHVIIVGRAFLCGYVEVGDYARVSPATVLQRKTIGEHAFVGIGSLVTHDVPAHAIVCGLPAMPVEQFKRCLKAWKRHGEM